MKRRDFLKVGSCGLAAVALGSAGGWSMFRPSTAHALSGFMRFEMIEVDAQMVDGVIVPMWSYDTDLLARPGIPGPVLFAVEGETIQIEVRNRIANGGPHGFTIPGVVDSGPIAFNDEADLVFTAPKAGTYMYSDQQNGVVNRVMGLHGMLVVLPSAVGFNPPYSDPTPNVQALFNDLGDGVKSFPGHPWDPNRNGIWVFNTVDPFKNAAAAANGAGIAPATFLNGYLSQYFTINGKSGFFAAQHGHSTDGGSGGDVHPDGQSPDPQAHISISGHIGQPVLIRNINAGLMWNSPHIHGNHVYPLAENGTVLNHLEMVDTWTMPPGARKDVLLPFIQPPDIPAATWSRFEGGTSDELFPLIYPMHDHNEISNTAAGANYPHGLATHWQIDGALDVNQGVILVQRADLRLRSGHLELQGTFSGPAGSEIDVHAGDTALPANRIGSAIVQSDGSWSYRGRALKAIPSRMVTLHVHATGSERSAVSLKIR
jgi:FtsP/CotA-like multicopper oxidase with cupredoxin domain